VTLIFGDGAFRVLLFAHAVSAIVLAGAQGHAASLAVARLRGREVASARLTRHLLVVAGCFAVSFALGLLGYPHYRYHVRGLLLDRDFPWASNLFDLKEQVAALAVPLLLASLGLEREGSHPRAAARLELALSALVFFVVGAGLIVTSVRGA
jgi:hypothetical protein